MIPPRDYALLKEDKALAASYARAGQPDEGFAVLDAGLAVAESLPHEPWSGELILRYRRALVQYCRRCEPRAERRSTRSAASL